MKSQSLIVMPFGLPFNWSADYEKQTLLELNKKNVIIGFLVAEGQTLRQYMQKREAGLIEISRNNFLFKPLYLIPFQRFKIIQKLNYFIASWFLQWFIHVHKEWRHFNKIFWSFSLQNALFPHYFCNQYFKIYDSVDTFDTEHGHAVIKNSDVVFTNQLTLYEHTKSKHLKTYRVPVGFSTRSKSKTVALKHPNVTFIGNINNRIDFDLLYEIIIQLPKVHIYFIGKYDANFTVPGKNFSVEITRIKTLPNTFFVGPVDKKVIPSYIDASDVGLIPYDTNQDFNRLCFPMKTLEYFYYGKPVISTPILEMEKLKPYVTIIHNAEEGRMAIQKLISKPWLNKYQIAQKKFAEMNSWKKKIEAIRQILHKDFSVHI